MNPTAFLRCGTGPTPQLPLTFRHNVSSSIRVFAKENIDRQIQKCNTNTNNNGCQIRCTIVSKPPPSGYGGGGGPLGNAQMALQSLVCFSLDTAKEPETKQITAVKREALGILLANNPQKAMTTMTNACKRYQNDRKASGTIKYDATMALIEVLIHIGTDQSLIAAIDQLNYLGRLSATTESLPSDAKRPLYKAVIYTLLGEDQNAQQPWKDYTRAVGSGPRRR